MLLLVLFWNFILIQYDNIRCFSISPYVIFGIYFKDFVHTSLFTFSGNGRESFTSIEVVGLSSMIFLILIAAVGSTLTILDN